MLQIVNKRQRIPKGQSELDNPEKLVTYGTQDDEKQNTTQHNVYWTPLLANKHEKRKQFEVKTKRTSLL